MIATLSRHDLSGRTVGVQLYGSDANPKLMAFLEDSGATPDPVAPYVYAAESEDRRVVELIRQMASGDVNVIAFTSGPQVRRLWEVAQKSHLEDELRRGFERTKVATIGPVAAEEARKLGIRPDIMPERLYSMKPFVNEIIAVLGQGASARA